MGSGCKNSDEARSTQKFPAGPLQLNGCRAGPTSESSGFHAETVRWRRHTRASVHVASSTAKVKMAMIPPPPLLGFGHFGPPKKKYVAQEPPALLCISIV